MTKTVFRTASGLVFCGGVSHRSVAALARAIRAGDTVFITSRGGDLDAARAGFDVLAAAGATTVARGVVASAGALLFAAGANRVAEPSSIALVHEPRFTVVPSQTAAELAVAAANAAADREFYAAAFPGIELTEAEIPASAIV